MEFTLFTIAPSIVQLTVIKNLKQEEKQRGKAKKKPNQTKPDRNKAKHNKRKEVNHKG